MGYSNYTLFDAIIHECVYEVGILQATAYIFVYLLNYENIYHF